MAYRSRRYQHHGGQQTRPTFARRFSISLPEVSSSQKLLKNLSGASVPSHGVDEKQSKIEDVEFVASFNWKEAKQPTILVPGKPPRWQPPAIPSSLREDAGRYYRDPNSARFPTFPIEPAIRAIRELDPTFDVSTIDVFGCGNTIGSLLSFVRDEERTFRIGVELIGSSLFLVRKTNKAKEIIEGVHGYGHAFPEAHTIWEKSVKGSASHQRIIKYSFAGLKCFVRYEGDGYLPEILHGKGINNSTESSSVDHDSEADTSQLLSLVLGLQHSDSSTVGRLTVERAGELVPQQAVFDLKTRTIKRKISEGVNVDEFLPRLWVNQLDSMILAYHTRGTFAQSDIHIVRVKDRITEWEAQNTIVLSKLSGLLHKLIDMAKTVADGRFELRRTASEPLEVWSEVLGWSALPDDLKSLWGVSGDGIMSLNPRTSSSAQIPASSSTKKKLVNRGADDAEEDEGYLKF